MVALLPDGKVNAFAGVGVSVAKMLPLRPDTLTRTPWMFREPPGTKQ
jgi:hypothetical protein